MTSPTPFHQAQIQRTLPTWSKDLHPQHVSVMLSSLRKEHIDADGEPCDWYTQAHPYDQDALSTAIDVRDASRKLLQDALSSLQGITAFCRPLLEQRLGAHLSVDQVQYVFQASEPQHPAGGSEHNLGPTSPTELRPIVAKGKPQPRSLLEAALHNFEGPHDTTRLSHLQNHAHDISSLPGLTVYDFIDHCRALDLGQQYQEHLTSVYHGDQSSEINRLAIQVRCDDLRVHARVAVLQGELTRSGSTALHTLLAGNPEPTYDNRPLHCWRVSVFGYPIHEWMVIGPGEPNEINPVMLYMPGNDIQVKEFTSAQEAGNYLRQRLLEDAFFTRVVALAPHAVQPELTTRLRRALYSNTEQPWIARDKPHIEFFPTRLPAQPWSTLESFHVSRLKGDARTIAVPTADVDAKARLKLLEHWLDIGLTVLNMAAMCIPVLNPIMMTIGAAQIAGSVFEGIEAWEDGDNASALAQLESILINVGTIAVVGGGAFALKASGFVDAMQSIVKDGKTYLWSPELNSYENLTPLPEQLEPNEQGLYTLGDNRFVRLGDRLYGAQAEPNGQWRLGHANDPTAYRPRLLDNGEGAWRMEHEQPLDWTDAQLIKRLGPICDDLEAADLDFAMRGTAVDGDILRYTHIAGERPPALLADTLDLLRCERQTQDIIERVRTSRSIAAYRNYALPSLPELPGWPQGHVIKAFHGPEAWGEFTLYGKTAEPVQVEIQINRSELESGQLSDVVLAQMDEQAAQELLPGNTPRAEGPQALNDKLADHLSDKRDSLAQSLYTAHRRPLSSEAQVIRRQFDGLPDRAVEEILAKASPAERQRLATGRVPLRIGEEARAMQAHARLNKALLGLYEPRLANADSQRLAQALLAEHPGASASELLEAALADRAHAATLLGQQPVRPGYRSPMRLSDGRIGYPLSGRPNRLEWMRLPGRNTPSRRLQEIYPSLTQAQRNDMIQRMRLRGDVAEQINALRQQRDTLDNTLRDWVREGAEAQQANREGIREAINSAWRADTGTELTLQRLPVDTLPSLPARFDHITSVVIRNLGIQEIPTDFFQSFPALNRLHVAWSEGLSFDTLFQALQYAPRLRSLSLVSSRLGELTLAARKSIASLDNLRTLNLSRNDLQLGAVDIQFLSALRLENLDLQANRITFDAALAEHFTRMPQLRNLNVSNNPLGELDLTGMTQLRGIQVRDCQLRTWPRGLSTLMDSADAQLQILSMSGNPIAQIPELDQVLASDYVRNLRANRRAHAWDFNNSELDPPTVQQLIEAGVEIEADDVLLPEQAVGWLEGANQDQQQLWDALFHDGTNPQLHDVVNRAGRSDLAQRNLPLMARQIWQLLEQAGANEELRLRLESLAGDFPPTCGDAGTDAFSTLQAEAYFYSEVAQNPGRSHYLFQVYRRLYRRELVNDLASRISEARFRRRPALLTWEGLPENNRPAYESLPQIDELDSISDENLMVAGIDLIEIRLALRQALAGDSRLDFPEYSVGMLYREEAQISMGIEANVEAAVVALEKDAAARRAWIAQQPSWRRYLREQYPAEFDTLNQDWYQGQEYLDYCLGQDLDPIPSPTAEVQHALRNILELPSHTSGPLPRVELNDHQYNQASISLARAREDAQVALYNKLTREQDRNN